LLSEKWQIVYALNPMVGVVEAFRWALLGGDRAAPGLTLIISASVAVILLITGLLFFRRTERLFADMV
ncbi:MAG: ABC transporter permease, partial [Anaerolineaceae bacterium]